MKPEWVYAEIKGLKCWGEKVWADRQRESASVLKPAGQRNTNSYSSEQSPINPTSNTRSAEGHQEFYYLTAGLNINLRLLLRQGAAC